MVRGEGETYQVEIKIFLPASRRVKEEMLHPTQKIISSDNGTIIFSAEVPSLIEIKKWVLRLGSCAEVLKPEELKKEIIEEIKGMGRRYGR